jgi:DNA-binding transcriptional LysR family regulator
LRITAPAGFGRRHVAPLIPKFYGLHPEVTISLNLSDRVVDIAGEGFDCAVRVGDMPDSSLVSVRMADIRRLCVATPAYLARYGAPQTPAELSRFHCLTLSSDASQTRGWAFTVPVPDRGDAPTQAIGMAGKLQAHAALAARSSEIIYMKPAGPLDCSDGQVLHDWCLAGHGIAWRSIWEVEAEIANGQLVAVLEDYAAQPNGVYAVFPQRKHLPLRVRLWIDFLKEHYSTPGFWQVASR